MSEFDLIAHYFTWDNNPSTVSVSVGDDAAILDIPANKQLVTSIDTLISGVHFPENTTAGAIAHKALTVNLSDLAAMGATPAWFTLALTIPVVDENWLSDFSSSLKSLAIQHAIYLVGGDTTCGPLSISIQVMGFVNKGRALLRSGAKPDDKIYVTGTLGDASAGLQSIQNHLILSTKDKKSCEDRLNYPQVRLTESSVIKHFASACIDVSDGLLQDLSHILDSSNAGAELNINLLPLSSALKNIAKKQALQFALSGGDDYELLFTIPEKNEKEFLKGMKKIKGKVSCIGVINDKINKITDQDSNVLNATGYNHFHDK